MKFDDLSTEDYCRIVAADDPDRWEAQQLAFANLRDVCGRLAHRLDEMVADLRRSWVGEAAGLFDMAGLRVVAGFRALADSAASNSDGMREMTVVLRELRKAARLLHAEDDDWQANPDGDGAAVVAAARQSVRTELRDRLVEADDCLRGHAESFLVRAPDRLEISLPETTEMPRLQSAGASPAAVPSVAPPAVVVAGEPLLPGLGSMTPAPSATNGLGPRQGGATETVRGTQTGVAPPHGLSRMRSTESRQDIVNRLEGRKCPRDAGPERTVRVSEGESVFDPSDASVVPPIIAGPSPCGPHESGPVLTEPVFRLYPQYWRQLEDERAATPQQDAKNRSNKDSGAVSTKMVDGARPFATRIVRGSEYFRIVASLPRDQAREFMATQARLRREKS